MTPDQLAKILTPSDAEIAKLMAPCPPPDKVAEYCDALNAAMAEGGLSVPLVQAMFLANMAWESNNMTEWAEDCDWSAVELVADWPSLFPSIHDAAAYAHNPQAAANRAYANRGGNGPEASGDGWKYRGRSLTGLTFKNNYQQYGDQFGIDLVGNPDLAAETVLGCRIPVAFWNNRGITLFAVHGNFDATIKLINNACTDGPPSYAIERRKIFSVARSVLCS